MNEDLIDVKSSKKILKTELLRLFSFKSLYENSKSLTYGPPFEIAGLVNDKTKELYYVNIEDIEFYLHDFDQYEYKEYYLDYVS